jgi:predicted dehydrogenase
MKRDLKVGIIGAGGIARTRHIEGWQRLAEHGVRIAAIADTDKKRAAQMADEVGAAHVFREYKRLIALPELDIVDICTPTYAHKAQTVAALRAGKHVFCEKPMCINPAEGRAIVAAVRKSGRKFMVAQHQRFSLTAQAAKKVVARGTLGDIYHVRCHWLRRRLLPGAPTFIYKRFSGGGPLLDIGCHILDLALHLIGFPKPIAVMGSAVTKLAHRDDMMSEWGDWDRKGFDVEDFACGLVRFANGATLILETSWLLNMEQREEISLRLFGTEAGLAYPEMVVYGQHNGVLTETALTGISDNVHPHTRAIRAFYECIVNDTPSPVPADQNIHVIRILSALYQSSARRREVRL